MALEADLREAIKACYANHLGDGRGDAEAGTVLRLQIARPIRETIARQVRACVLDLYPDITKEERATLTSAAISGLEPIITLESRAFSEGIEANLNELSQFLESYPPGKYQERVDDEIGGFVRRILDIDDWLPWVDVDEVIKIPGWE